MEQHKAETANRRRRQGIAEDKADKDGKQTLDAMGGKQALEGKDMDGKQAAKGLECSAGRQRTHGSRIPLRSMRRVGRAPGRVEACKADVPSKTLPTPEELQTHGQPQLEAMHL